MLVDLRLMGAVIQPGYIVGYRDAASSLIRHVAIATVEQPLTGDGVLPVVHMLPRFGVTDRPSQVDLVAVHELVRLSLIHISEPTRPY